MTRAELRPVDRLFSGAPEVSEAIYRLSQAAREGKRGTEELRLTPPLLGDGAFGWYRIRVRPIERAAGPLAALWTVADVTRERERHENVFQELQHAIDFLDHAPAGFFSADPGGNISYMNATLADWLDYDLAQVGSGGSPCATSWPATGPHCLPRWGGPATVRTEQFDSISSAARPEHPVRLLHRVAFGQDGAPGASRTLVLNRAPGEEPAEESARGRGPFCPLLQFDADGHRRGRRDGRILRSNAAFAKPLPGR